MSGEFGREWNWGANISGLAARGSRRLVARGHGFEAAFLLRERKRYPDVSYTLYLLVLENRDGS